MTQCRCGNELTVSNSYKCDSCKKRTYQDRLNRTRGTRRANKRRYTKRHRHEPKYWIQEKISYWRTKHDVESDLTTEYLLELLNEQDGRCYYTGREMVFGGRDGKVQPDSASLDRLVPEFGYVQGNVAWCTFFVNTMKGGLTEREFYGLMSDILARKDEGHNLCVS